MTTALSETTSRSPIAALLRPPAIRVSTSRWRGVSRWIGSSCNLDQGRDVFRVFAIDRAGNADPSPARIGFRIRSAAR